MTIERCNYEDIPRIMELDSYVECSWSEDNIVNAFNNGITVFLKAIIGKKIIGYLSFDIILDEICINNIAVDSAYRRTGVASELLNKLSEYAFETKKTKIFLEVNEHNFPAIMLYEKAGFKNSFIRHDYYGKDKNAVVYVKNIQ